MKKIALSALILLGVSNLKAQNLDFYPGLVFQDSWHPLTGDSVIMNQGFDDQIVGPIAIPNFTMGGVAYNQVYISSNGFITLGQASSASEYSPITNGISAPIIAPFAANLAGSASANSSVSYKLSTSLQSNLEVQWSNVHRAGYPNEVFSFKINIDFGSYWNFINFTYGDFQNIAATPSAVQVGLRVGSGMPPIYFQAVKSTL